MKFTERGSIMPNQKQPFRQHLVARGIKGALAGGAHNASVEFHTPDGGKIVVVGSKPPEPVATVAARKPMRPSTLPRKR
jgi:hypothetical protein